MSGNATRKFILPVTLLLLLGLSSEAGAAPAAVKKTTAHKGQSRTHRSYLVPPPPAYMPTILPEHYATTAAAVTAPEMVAEEPPKPENPYKAYFYSADEGNAPRAMTARSGVSTWSPPPTRKH